jgi:hypothetical protein
VPRPCPWESSEDPADLLSAAAATGRFVFAPCDVTDPAHATRTVELVRPAS